VLRRVNSILLSSSSGVDQSKLNDLKSDFGTLQRVMKMEDRLVGVLSFSKAPSEPNPPRQLWHQQAQS